MEMEELLKTLGLDNGLSSAELLEQLEEKNLEYLERLDACTDEARAAELRKIQEQIETTIQKGRSGVSLQREPAKTTKKAGKAAQDQEPVVAKAISRTSAKKTTPAPASSPQAVVSGYSSQRELFEAAQAGDGKAALELAQLYYKDENYESAWKWGKTAHTLSTPGATQFMMSLSGKAGSMDELLALCVQGVSQLTGYDQYAVCEKTYIFLRQERLSHQQIQKTAEDILSVLSPESPARDMMEELRQSAEKALAKLREQELQRKKEKEAREQADKAAQEREKARRQKEQREAAQLEAWRQRQLFWQKIFPVIFCIFAPPILAYGIEKLSLALLEGSGLPNTPNILWILLDEDLAEFRGAMAVHCVIPTILAGFMCCFLMWKLPRPNEKRDTWKALIVSPIFTIVALALGYLLVLALLNVTSSKLPVTIGPFTIAYENIHIYSHILAFYICSITAAVRGLY